MTKGSRAQVWRGTVDETTGGLKREDLFQDKYGRIRSKKASKAAKKNNNLKKAGWTYEKGKFGSVRIEDVQKRSNKKRSNKKRSNKKRSNKKRSSKK